MLQTSRQRGLVLAAIALVVLVGFTSFRLQSDARADAEAEQVAAELVRALEAWDTADEYFSDAMAGSLPELPRGTVISLADGLTASATIRIGSAARCVTVQAVPTWPSGHLETEEPATADGRC